MTAPNYITLTSDDIGANKILRAATASALDSNPVAIAQRGTGAPWLNGIGEWERLKAQYNWTCPCCKKQEPKIKLTRDHIVAVTRGGSNNIENIQPLCLICDIRKQTKVIKYEL